MQTAAMASDTGTESRRGRPALVLLIWAVLMLALASIAPDLQLLLGIPFELLSAVMLAPAVACAVVLIRPRWMPTPWARGSERSVVVASGAAVVAVGVFFAVLLTLSGARPAWPASTGGAPLIVFLLVQALGALCEEVGWRGVVQRCGESFARPALVSALGGFLFGVTHLGYWQLGIIPVLTFGVTAMLMSLTITTLFTGSLWQRMIPAVIVHFGLNLTITALSGDDEALGTGAAALAAALAMFVVAGVLRVTLRSGFDAQRG